jgi:hypothetical protein
MTALRPPQVRDRTNLIIIMVILNGLCMFIHKNFFMKRFLNLLIMAVVINSCGNGEKEKPDGGPCSYEDKTYPAKLIKLEENADSITYNGRFEIDNPFGKGKDTISYLRMTNQSISKEQLQKDSIAVGNIYKYVVSKIKMGDCNPDIRTIRLEKY